MKNLPKVDASSSTFSINARRTLDAAVQSMHNVNHLHATGREESAVEHYLSVAESYRIAAQQFNLHAQYMQAKLNEANL